jgi:plasmid stability protein
MPNIFVRGLSDKTMQRLKDRARRSGRSIQSEAKLLFEQLTGTQDVRALLDRWAKRFTNRQFSSSAVLIREDRIR